MVSYSPETAAVEIAEESSRASVEGHECQVEESLGLILSLSDLSMNYCAEAAQVAAYCQFGVARWARAAADLKTGRVTVSR